MYTGQKISIPKENYTGIYIKNPSSILIDAIEDADYWYFVPNVSGDWAYQRYNDVDMDKINYLKILPNLSGGNLQSTKSKNRIMVEALEAAIEGRATSVQKSMAVGDKNIQYLSLDELISALNYYKNKMKTEESGSVSSKQILYTMKGLK